MASSTPLNRNLSKLWERVEGRAAWHLQSVGSQRVGHDIVTEQQQERSVLTQNTLRTSGDLYPRSRVRGDPCMKNH